jgi:hypothetical protein
MILPPLSILLPLAVLSLVWAWRHQQPVRKQLWRPVHWLVFSHLLFFGMAILIGDLYPYDRPARTVHHRADQALDFLFFASLASCAFWIWRMKGFRWFAASLMAVMQCPILGALFIAGMSVTGTWL